MSSTPDDEFMCSCDFQSGENPEVYIEAQVFYSEDNLRCLPAVRLDFSVIFFANESYIFANGLGRPENYKVRFPCQQGNVVLTGYDQPPAGTPGGSRYDYRVDVKGLGPELDCGGVSSHTPNVFQILLQVPQIPAGSYHIVVYATELHDD